MTSLIFDANDDHGDHSDKWFVVINGDSNDDDNSDNNDDYHDDNGDISDNDDNACFH
jgi:hypothetical protein